MAAAGRCDLGSVARPLSISAVPRAVIIQSTRHEEEPSRRSLLHYALSGISRPGYTGTI